MPSELEDLIFTYFWAENRVLGRLRLSWRHLGANMAPCWGPTWLHVGAQDAPKTRKKRRQCQDEVEKPTPGGVPHRFCSEKPMGYPSWARFLEHFWFHFAAKLRLCWGIWLHFATQFQLKRARFFSPERRQYWRFLNDRSQVKRGGGHAA